MLEGDEGWVDGCCGCMEAAVLCCCGLGSNWMMMQTTPFLSFQWCSVSSSTLQAMLLPCPALYGGFSCTASGCRALLPVRSVLPCFLAQPLGHKLSQNRAAET